MFKTTLTAAAFTLIAGFPHAAPAPLDLDITATPAIEATIQFEEVAYYCEWAYAYDTWGNWVTVWQCF